jgi:hypothetical protein
MIAKNIVLHPFVGRRRISLQKKLAAESFSVGIEKILSGGSVGNAAKPGTKCRKSGKKAAMKIF